MFIRCPICHGPIGRMGKPLVYPIRCSCGAYITPDRATRTCAVRSIEISSPPRPGLGDRLAAIIDRFGGRRFKNAYRRIFGRDCGCRRRQHKLNQLGQQIASLFRRHPT